MSNMDIIVKRLIKRGKKLLRNPYEPTVFTKNVEADMYLNDFNTYPHHFVLGCAMDQQIKAERAWVIPYLISEKIGTVEFDGYLQLTLEDYLNLFSENSFHRFNERMARFFYSGVQRIHNVYNDNAGLIWKKKVPSATIVRRFMQFDGMGIKIATMTTNILARDFKVPMKDKLCIEISPDRQVKRVFKRIGLIDKNSSNDDLIYCARELNPKYPGIFDFSAWEIGRTWCRPKNPKCGECYLDDACSKILN